MAPETKRTVNTTPAAKPVVGIIMGSDSDWPTMKAAADACAEFGIAHEVRVISAHRTPRDLERYASTAHGRGLRVIIAGAGGAAHLPGVTAAFTPLPVIGVPIESKALQGTRFAPVHCPDAQRHTCGDGCDWRRPERGLARGANPGRRRCRLAEEVPRIQEHAWPRNRGPRTGVCGGPELLSGQSHRGGKAKPENRRPKSERRPKAEIRRGDWAIWRSV